MTTPSTSRHSALSELMIQNAELREQLRVLQSAYDSLSQIKEKSVASRIEVDELKEENDSLKAENASLKDLIELDKASAYRIIDNLKADNARLRGEKP